MGAGQFHPQPGVGQCGNLYEFGSWIPQMFHSNGFCTSVAYAASSPAERSRKGQALIISRVEKIWNSLSAKRESELAEGTWRSGWLRGGPVCVGDQVFVVEPTCQFQKF